MSDCVCCKGGHENVVAKEGDRWCQQCQKDGCPQPKLEATVPPRDPNPPYQNN